MSNATDRHAFREVLAGLASKTQAKMPSLNGRVEKATRLVLQGDVELLDADTALVHSMSEPGRTYRLEQRVCTCKDYDHAPEHLCCHRLAVGFSRKIQELLPQSTSPETTPALPEAPASVNLKVLVQGHEVMVTLRDTDESALLTRLGALLKRSDVRPIPKPAPRSGGWKRQYQGH